MSKYQIRQVFPDGQVGDWHEYDPQLLPNDPPPPPILCARCRQPVRGQVVVKGYELIRLPVYCKVCTIIRQNASISRIKQLKNAADQAFLQSAWSVGSFTWEEAFRTVPVTKL